MEGLRFMAVGMGVVFCFLILMVLAMQAMGAFFLKYAHLFPEPVEAPAPRAAAAKDHTAIAIAIAAVRAFKG